MLYIKFPLFTKFIFFNPSDEIGHIYGFSSDLEKIGTEWDIRIPNGVYIEPVSEPLEIYRQKYGTISVIKIKADVTPNDYRTVIKEFWIPSSCVVELKNSARN